MGSLWLVCGFLALLPLKAITDEDADAVIEKCEMRVMVFEGYQRTMCAPLQEVWVLSKGVCRKGFTCAKGYSERECKEKCLKKRSSND
ncbi:uncharacterized protein LOC132788817 [Drosophila nasuta]|uniref:uncharacterized protein LOC132788817 n=1 Tax=Drosophila nasuta TaxID=42062 RepID=UPI00295EABFB|nr:uncharacterized protein LOC132788817 [Drosophila nasuta]